MRMNTTHLWLAISLFFIIISCGTQDDALPESFSVTGIVTTGDGVPIEGVEVNSIVDTVFTDANGQYQIKVFPTGPIEYKKEGFETWVELVQERTVIDVWLLDSGIGGTRYEQITVSTPCSNGSIAQISKIKVSDFGEGTGTITWTNDKVWILQTRVFVNEGQILTIEPGTIIKGETGQAESASALIVARGGKIMAEGTADNPIIFTSIEDKILKDVNGNFCSPSSLTNEDKGLWGGLIILGKATINTSAGENEVEGFSDPFGRGIYGGNDDNDNSGIIKYVSVRHGGTSVTINNEINAITMAGVGQGTIIEYCEAYANSDDGFEWFGGTVNTRYLVSAFNADDAFDYDEGWRGKNQFWLAYQGEDADFGGEHDGGVGADETAPPFSNPTIANATYWGAGKSSGKGVVFYRDNAAGAYYNSIFLNYGKGVEIEYLGPSEQDCYQNLFDGLLTFKNNILFEIEDSPVFSIMNSSALPNDNSQVTQARSFIENYFEDPVNNNAFTDPGLTAQLIPMGGSAATQTPAIIGDPFFVEANYRGCFSPNNARWIQNWTRVENDF